MRKLTVNDVRLNVFDRGSGPPILFVHGFPMDHTMWQAQLDEFAAGHRVIAPDLRGFGGSGAATGRVSMDRFADDLNSLLDELEINEPVSLCGLSLGGYIAWSFIRRHPRRLRSLVLCDTRAEADTPQGVRRRMKMSRMMLEHGPEPIAEAMLSNLFAAATHNGRPDVIERVRQMIVGTAPASISAALYAMAERADATELLGEIRVPTLVVVGVEDQLSPAETMRHMAERIDGAEFVEIPDSGHLSPMENPRVFNAALKRFLASLRE